MLASTHTTAGTRPYLSLELVVRRRKLLELGQNLRENVVCDVRHGDWICGLGGQEGSAPPVARGASRTNRLRVLSRT